MHSRFVLCLLAIALAVLRTFAATNPPSIVVVFCDDTPYHIFSATGHPYSSTPNIDRLATEGALFRKAFVATPLCSPSRATYLTGTHPQMHDIKDNATDDNNALRVFPSILQGAGYYTGFVGKWHMGTSNAIRPGFDYWAAWAGQGVYTDPTINVNGVTQTYTGYVADVVTDRAVDFINTAPRPFCLWVAHKNTHEPRTPAPRHANLYPNAETDPNISAAELEQIRCIRSVDDSVGTILQTLTNKSILSNTLVVFVSDSGFTRQYHHPVSGGDKRGPYDEMTRVPLFMRLPSLIPGNTVLDQLVSSVDLAPTLLTVAGQIPPNRMPGLALQPLFSGTPPWRDILYSSYFRDAPPYDASDPWRAVRTSQWKYVTYVGTTTELLFDLVNDPLESTNVITQNPTVAADLRAQTSAFYAQTSIPKDWLQQDIGAVAAAGSTVATLGRTPSIWTVKGSGAGIKGTADEFHYPHRDLIGDGTITARLTSFSTAPAGAAAGVMIRGSTNANSRFVSVSFVNGQGGQFSYRATAGGPVTSVAFSGTALPRWFQLKRVGNLFSGYKSSDGNTWTSVGSVTLSTMPSAATAGLAVTSNSDGTLVTATYENVGVTQP